MKLYRKMPHEEWEATEPVDFLYDESSEVILVTVAGWWAQWCVHHYSALYEFDGADPTMCDERRSGAAGFCRWHPQGAFIPEVADDE